MPIYEYRCRSCRHKFSMLVGVGVGSEDVVCPKCNAVEADRLVSKFIRGRSEDDRVDEIADRLETMAEPESTAEMRELMKEMGKAMDEDASAEMEEMFEADMEGKLEDED